MNSISLSSDPVTINGCPPKWYEFQLKGKSSWDDLVENSELIVIRGNGFNYTLDNLHPATEYSYKITAYNDAGQKSLSQTTVKTKRGGTYINTIVTFIC